MKAVFVILIAVCIVAAVLLWPIKKAHRGFTDHAHPWDEPRYVHSVLTPDECKYLIKTAEPNFKRSELVGVIGPDDTRTSETAWISKNDPVVRKVMERACELTGQPYENCEDLQVVRYTPGTFYRSHHDSCCETKDSCIDFEERGGQRVGTLLVYLNDDFTGGETHFPLIDQTYKAPTGSAVFFRPLGTSSAQCHPNALHAGLPVESGTKYVCNAWIRESSFK